MPKLRQDARRPLDQVSPHGGARSILFAALARRSLRQQGADALTKVERRDLKAKQRPARVHSHHAEVRYQLIPHPRYGDRVPHFRSYLAEIDCNCAQARITGSLRRAARRAERATRPAVVDARASFQQSGTSGTKRDLCGHMTKLGTSCRRPARDSGFCAWHEQFGKQPEAVSFRNRGA